MAKKKKPYWDIDRVYALFEATRCENRAEFAELLRLKREQVDTLMTVGCTDQLEPVVYLALDFMAVAYGLGPSSNPAAKRVKA